MQKITPPNYTQIPNVYFDEIMQTLTTAENTLFLLIMRKTFGWHKKKDKISYSQLRELSGISSNDTVKKAIEGLIKKDLIKAEKKGQIISYEVTITETVKDNDSNLYRNCNSTFTETVIVNDKTFTETVNTKERLNKIKETSDIEKNFTDFYSQYPKKVDKTDSKKVFTSLLKKGITLEEIMLKLEIYKDREKNTELKYIRSPARFLRTLEDYELPTQQPKKEIEKTIYKCKKCDTILRDEICPKCFALHTIEGELV